MVNCFNKTVSNTKTINADEIEATNIVAENITATGMITGPFTPVSPLVVDEVQTDLINEKTLNNGVNIDGVLLKDNQATIGNINILNNAIISTNTNGNVDIIPNGTGVTRAISDFHIESGKLIRLREDSPSVDIFSSQYILDGANFCFRDITNTGTVSRCWQTGEYAGNVRAGAWTSHAEFVTPVSTIDTTLNLNGNPVLNKDTLLSAVTSAPGLTSVGTLTELQVDNVNINGNLLSSSSNSLLLQSATSRIGVKYLGPLSGSDILTFRDDVLLDRWGFRYEDDTGTQCMVNLLNDDVGATRVALWGYYAGSNRANALTKLMSLTVSGANTYGILNLPHSSASISINSNTVLTRNTLGSGIINSSLQNVGTLTELQVDFVNINGGVVSSTSGNLTLSAQGTNKVRTTDNLIVKDGGISTPYALSVQTGSNDGFCYIEILDSTALTNQGMFFGSAAGGAGISNFELWNYQGGDIDYYVGNGTPSTGSIKFRMKRDGVMQILDLGAGIVQSDASGNLSSGSANVNLGDLNVTGNTIANLNTNGSVNLTPSGTGRVDITNMDANGTCNVTNYAFNNNLITNTDPLTDIRMNSTGASVIKLNDLLGQDVDCGGDLNIATGSAYKINNVNVLTATNLTMGAGAGVVSSSGNLTLSPPASTKIVMNQPITRLTNSLTLNASVINVLVYRNDLRSNTVGDKVMTLANGVEGQEIFMFCEAINGNQVITPASTHGFTTITFTALGQSCKLFYSVSYGWIIQSVYGGTVV